jgi:hypothetical protein
MRYNRLYTTIVASALMLSLGGCGGGSSSVGSGLFSRKAATTSSLDTREANRAQTAAVNKATGEVTNQTSFFDLFNKSADPNSTVNVNKYLWSAALEVLNFLPVESVDPFSGVIVTGYGTPPGGGKAYRATILVNDPALDARSLTVSMQTRGGAAVAPETLKAVEDAILTRARQLRMQDSKL